MKEENVTFLCPCCMESHEPVVKKVQEQTIFQEQEVSYIAEYMYCPTTDEYYANEQQMRVNDIAMKNAYRTATGRLTSSEIAAIRAKYQVSQSDFAKILGAGEKTIARYETFQVQTEAYDSLLRKVARDPEWYLELLFNARDLLSESAYDKSRSVAMEAFAEISDRYQQNAFAAKQARYRETAIFHGSRQLDVAKIVDVINYLASSAVVNNLYTVKLMKLLWYADFLCYKRHRHSITGMAYQALPMGAVPAGYQSMMELRGVNYETELIQDTLSYHFVCDEGYIPQHLTEEEIRVLDVVIQQFGRKSKTTIVNQMHEETAFTETPKGEAIAYSYADQLSLE